MLRLVPVPVPKSELYKFWVQLHAAEHPAILPIIQSSKSFQVPKSEALRNM